MWCWRRMEKIVWSDDMSNEVSQRVKEERNILQTIKIGMANLTGHIFCRNLLLKHFIEEKIEERIEEVGR